MRKTTKSYTVGLKVNEIRRTRWKNYSLFYSCEGSRTKTMVTQTRMSAMIRATKAGAANMDGTDFFRRADQVGDESEILKCVWANRMTTFEGSRWRCRSTKASSVTESSAVAIDWRKCCNSKAPVTFSSKHQQPPYGKCQKESTTNYASMSSCSIEWIRADYLFTPFLYEKNFCSGSHSNAPAFVGSCTFATRNAKCFNILT